jgi:hypothetical protein
MNQNPICLIWKHIIRKLEFNIRKNRIGYWDCGLAMVGIDSWDFLWVEFMFRFFFMGFFLLDFFFFVFDKSWVSFLYYIFFRFLDLGVWWWYLLAVGLMVVMGERVWRETTVAKIVWEKNLVQRVYNKSIVIILSKG